MKKRFAGILAAMMASAFMVGFLSGCGNNREQDDLVWTNDNAVYAYVKAGFENDVLKDVESTFASLQFQKVYVTEKNVNEWTPLGLLFVLEEDKLAEKQDFIRVLREDERINHIRACQDLWFETVDTRCIEKEKDTIAVGETSVKDAANTNGGRRQKRRDRHNSPRLAGI